MEQLPIPATKRQDARNRAMRTLAQGFIASGVLTAGTWLGANFAGIEWTREGLIGAAYSLGGAVITAGCSWAARFLLPPTAP